MGRQDLLTKFDEKINVLNDGHVRVVDALGDDSAIVQAARVAYGHGTKTVSDDRTLIRYLMRHRHTTPFEMCMLKLHIRAPMDVWRQWIRHRTAHVNEYSTRYSEAIDSRMTTEPNEWRAQSGMNKQGSGDILDESIGVQLSESELRLHNMSHAIYKQRLDAGVAREQARKDLPLSTYTEAYWMIDLHNLLHFLGLRVDSHAQWEIRQYANIIANMVYVWCPNAYEAWLDYRRDALTLSRAIRDIVYEWNTAKEDAALDRIWSIACEQGWIKMVPGRVAEFKYSRNRERDEVETTLLQLGLPIFWRQPYARTG